jgi:hypothetical protein
MVICPANGTEIVKRHTDYILTNPSAQGAIREVCELVIRSTIRGRDFDKWSDIRLSLTQFSYEKNVCPFELVERV